jgi:serine/threonine protein kinase/tetratricopeptide (TPR) repeat protein
MYSELLRGTHPGCFEFGDPGSEEYTFTTFVRIGHMTPEQWQLVTRLWARCLDNPQQDPQELLAESDVTDEIRLEVQALLGAHERIPQSFLENVVPESDEAHQLEAGEVVANRFRIVRFLGKGGVGEVYEARDQDVGEAIALKLVLPAYHDSPEVSARLRREVQLARRVAHPNVCRIFDLNRHVFPWGDGKFITMELLQGVTLAKLMRDHGTLTPEESLPYLRQILIGLQAVHDLGIVHRDLKPGNIMVSASSKGEQRCVLMDFGLAREHVFADGGETLTRTREVLGTFAYMAPEQLAGEQVSTRSDLYSFGVIMFELLHGYRPSQALGKKPGSDAARIRKSSEPQEPAELLGPVPRKIPKEWSQIIARCLNADPTRRPSSPSEILAILERKPRISRRHVVVAGLAAGASALIGGTGFLYWRASGPHFVAGSSILVAGPLSEDGDPIGSQVRASLRQSSRLTLWDNSKVRDVWKRMGRQDPPAPSARDWREIALREAVPYVLFPSTSQVGDGTSLTFRLEQLRNNADSAKAWQESFEAVDKEHLFEAIEAGSRWIRDLIGESARDIDNSSAKPQAVTTPSWDALKEFSRGESLIAKGDRAGAVLAFRSAARTDPLFTMAWMRLGDVQVQLGRDNDAFSAWQQADEVSRQRPLTRKEDLRFRGMLASDSWNYADAEKFYAEYTHYFPDEWYGRFYRALPLLMLGRVSESTAEMEKCLSFPFVEASACLQLVMHYLYAGDRQSAESMVTRLKKLSSGGKAGLAEAMIAYDVGDAKAAVEALTRAATDRVLMERSRETLAKAIALADAGMIGDAIDTLQMGSKEDEQAGERERWAAKLIGLAWLLDMEKDPAAARKAIEPLRRVEVGPVYTGAAGVLFARFDDRIQAERLLATISPNLDYPRFASPRLRIQAELQFGMHNIAEGLQLARQAAEVEPLAFGSDYLAASLDHFGSKQEALAEYKISPQ